jgi:hypothetical protein
MACVSLFLSIVVVLVVIATTAPACGATAAVPPGELQTKGYTDWWFARRQVGRRRSWKKKKAVCGAAADFFWHREAISFFDVINFESSSVASWILHRKLFFEMHSSRMDVPGAEAPG